MSETEALTAEAARQAAIEEGTAEAERIAEAIAAEQPAEPAAEPPKPGYERRKSAERTRIETLERELQTYKARDRERELAELTETERLKRQAEENAAARETAERTLRQYRVGAEAGLPVALWAKLDGSDDDAMRADAELMKRYVARAKAGVTTEPAKEAAAAQKLYSRRELRENPRLAASDEVLQAMREGRITD